ncbi:MAG TPA: hypothetical protein PKV41_06270, partial [Candidatus Omnitrophota bacterium]|nr:hypothetical protein [Candidatus Omnitrophota bacterium]
MRWFRRTIQFWLCGLILFSAAGASAAVTLKLSASNPSTFASRTIPFKSYLPKGILPEHVISAGDLEVVYDQEREQSYVYKDLTLEPQASAVFEIVLEDVWLISDEELDALKAQIDELVKSLTGTQYEELARQIQGQALEKIDEVILRQEESLIYTVGPTEHISAYDANREALAVIKGNVNDLERMIPASRQERTASVAAQQAQALKFLNAKKIKDQVLNFGVQGVQDSCLVEESLKIERENIALDPRDTIVMRIDVENPSATKPRTAPLRFFLAREVQASDVLDPDVLRVGFDFEKSLYYVYDDQIALDPGETKEFRVTLNNRWAIDKRRLYGLKVYLEGLLKAMANDPELAESKELGTRTLNDIYSLLRRTDPIELTEEHVAAFRNDLTKVDRIRQTVQGLEDALAARKISPELAVMDQELFCREARVKSADKPKDLFGIGEHQFASRGQ